MKCCTDCGAVLKDREGRPCSELYDKELYSKAKILKLMPCAECGAQVADRYVECDGVLLLIDLLLQTKQAYRHVLLNGNYTSLILKMTLLTVVTDAYIGWSETAGPEVFFEQEYQFYLKCLKVAMALAGYLIAVLVPSLCCFDSRGDSKLLLGLLLAYSSRFSNLMALIWSDVNGNFFSNQVMWIFVYLLFFISSVRVHQITQKTRLRFTSWAQLALGHVVFLTVLSIDSILNLCHPVQ